jgi:hypothetical protein
MWTVRDFLEACSQDWIDVNLYNTDTGDVIKINLIDIDDEKYEEIMDATFETWDLYDGEMTINYSI